MAQNGLDNNSSIIGTVMDRDNNATIEGAEVTIYYDNDTIAVYRQTDSNGRFEVTNLSSGRYHINISAQYYHQSIKIIILSENETQKFNFTLKAIDTDGDGVPDYWDEFPEDPTESVDTDGDGVGDNTDEFPNDPTKSKRPKEKDDDDGGAGEDVSPMTEESFKKISSLNFFLIAIIAVIVINILIAAVIYTRLKSRRLLEHRTRERIYNHIQNNPGVHYRGIMNDLELSMGVLSHHLNMLERQNFVKSMQDGTYRRFYPIGHKIDTRLLLTQPQETILDAIKSNPGISQSKLAEELNMTKKTVYYNVSQLRDSGLVFVDKDGRESECFYAGET
ncbi:MAG: winged helix-turn-helix transcriptional regulator [Thermoplasmata archaeon]|nr:MAG: winged helix-turn-helix transcriptional regulator [Thermoplasmata archaeon]